jgi:hypothetical protein
MIPRTCLSDGKLKLHITSEEVQQEISHLHDIGA